jgi:hypothetical protein
MPVRIVLDHPRRYTFRRLWRRILMETGALLLVVGIAASIVAVPANVLAAAWFLDEVFPTAQLGLWIIAGADLVRARASGSTPPLRSCGQ